jgi:hypothetical protein
MGRNHRIGDFSGCPDDDRGNHVAVLPNPHGGRRAAARSRLVTGVYEDHAFLVKELCMAR